MPRYALLVLSTALLVGCSSMSDVTLVGPDTYMVASSSSAMGEGGGKLKAELAQKAGEFCAAQGKVPLLVESSASDMAFGRPASAEITFRCVDDEAAEGGGDEGR